MYPIEKQRWGVHEGVIGVNDFRHTHGLFSFNRERHGTWSEIERTLMEYLKVAVMTGDRLALSAVARDVEADLTLPAGSLVRLPANAPYRE